jgi:hypothetical protein
MSTNIRAALTLVVTLLPGCASRPVAPSLAQPDEDTVERVVAYWNPTSREVARRMMAKYGPPHEITISRLVWHDNGPWLRSEVSRDPVPHFFPEPHGDSLLQVIAYRVPPGRLADLAAFSGSVTAHRTRGELAACGEREATNLLALNLAHEIVAGIRRPDDARVFYTGVLIEEKNEEYTRRFLFDLPRGDQGDPDRELRP